uniref:Fibrinogen C-terminal domain-containing protein n=1 Tax=Anopheles farauti TaxID=69004 RepID=A0A182QMZ3_9DIPT
MTFVAWLLVVALGAGLCEASFSILGEPRQTCAGYSGISDRIAALIQFVSGQTPAVDPLVDLKSAIDGLLQMVTVYQSCDVVQGAPGLYRIWDGNAASTQYYCQTELYGGGWTMIQRRTSARTNFTRSYQEYKDGFGHPEQDFWIGLTRLNQITSLEQYELAVLMDGFDGSTATARYTSFMVGPESDGFRLTTLSGYSGTGGNSMSTSVGMMFSTFDNDRDTSTTENCANIWKGGWWFSNCGDSNLNGFYAGATPTTTPRTAMVWNGFKGLSQSLKTSIMLIRKKV